MTVLICNVASIVCAGAATYLAVHALPGWGWFLFASAAMAALPKGSKP